jgi:copper(I)-binding protein
LTPGTTVYFPVTQECEKGAHRWVEIPAAGQDTHTLKSPAPGVRLTAAAAKSAAAPSYKIGALVLEAPWIRATPGGAQVAGGYVKISNTGTEPDRLVGGTFPLAAAVEVHEMGMTDGVMKMRSLPNGLEIKPGASVDLKPGGYHLMFQKLQSPLKEGQAIKGTLVFEKAGPVEVEYKVMPIGSSGGGVGGGGHSHH